MGFAVEQLITGTFSDADSDLELGQERFAAAGKVLEVKEIQDGIDLLRFHLNCLRSSI